ncbi:hypothetical protein [Pseudanabaena sp. PCC 6802]|uniref:hypothetical protein n=1 Tax=Pseudanabaena sp. PCC 6802 TaxID=118173 RepID=UPI00034C9857|nr:hypothetical protein [Pseudanabaena sp. PCC 6802]
MLYLDIYIDRILTCCMRSRSHDLCDRSNNPQSNLPYTMSGNTKSALITPYWLATGSRGCTNKICLRGLQVKRG